MLFQCLNVFRYTHNFVLQVHGVAVDGHHRLRVEADVSPNENEPASIASRAAEERKKRAIR